MATLSDPHASVASVARGGLDYVLVRLITPVAAHERDLVVASLAALQLSDAGPALGGGRVGGRTGPPKSRGPHLDMYDYIL